MKLFSFIVGLSSITGAVVMRAAVKSEVSLIQSIDQKNDGTKKYKIYIDIDGVCLERDRLETAIVLATHLPIVVLNALWLPNIWSAIMHAKHNGMAAEGWIEWGQQRSTIILLSAMIKKIQDSKKVIQGTIDIIRELRAQGHTVYAATNMGTNEFGRHSQDKLKGLFDGATTVDYARKPVVKKPSLEYYQHMMAGCGSSALTVFIDDGKQNVKAARVAKDPSGKNLFNHVFHFTKPELLRKDLERIHAL